MKKRALGISPPLLSSGDKLGIVAVGKKISEPEISLAIQHYSNWGLQVVLGETIGAEDNYFAGSDELRAKDLQRFIDDDSIKAIVFARGGYGAVRILDKVDFSALTRSPKWLVGFSDVTAVHCEMARLEIPSIHGIMPVFFPTASKASIESCRKTLFEGTVNYQIKNTSWHVPGKNTAKLVGGNLSVLYSLLGSRSAIQTDNCILYLEDLFESFYHVDRMLQNMKRNGLFQNLKGVILGSFTDMNPGTPLFKENIDEIFKEYFEHLNIPICSGITAGHIDDNHSLILGQNVELNVNSDIISIISVK